MRARRPSEPVSPAARVAGRLAVAALLVAVAVLPASGLVLCQERDGRATVEAALGAGCCEALSGYRPTENAHLRGGDCAGCVDTVLKLVATQPRHAAVGCPGCAASLAAVRVGPAWQNRATQPHREAAGSPLARYGLRDLRSVVLLT